MYKLVLRRSTIRSCKRTGDRVLSLFCAHYMSCIVSFLLFPVVISTSMRSIVVVYLCEHRPTFMVSNKIIKERVERYWTVGNLIRQRTLRLFWYICAGQCCYRTDGMWLTSCETGKKMIGWQYSGRGCPTGDLQNWMETNHRSTLVMCSKTEPFS